DLFGPCLVTVNVEGDSHPEQSLFCRLLVPSEFGITYRLDALKQQTGPLPRRSVGIKHLVVKTACVVSIKKHKKKRPEPNALGRPRPVQCVLVLSGLEIKSVSSSSGTNLTNVLNSQCSSEP